MFGISFASRLGLTKKDCSHARLAAAVLCIQAGFGLQPDALELAASPEPAVAADLAKPAVTPGGGSACCTRVKCQHCVCAVTQCCTRVKWLPPNEQI